MRRVLILLVLVTLALLAALHPGRASADGEPSVVFIAQAEDFPDALSGAVLATSHNAPLLFVSGASHRDEVPGRTAGELQRLAPQRIVVLGGPAAVSQEVVDELARYATTGDVERLAGADRFATAAAIARVLPARIREADRLDGLDSSVFLRAGAKVGDADRIDGLDSSAFLLAGAKAADADRLDGFDSADLVARSALAAGVVAADGTPTTGFGIARTEAAGVGLYCVHLTDLTVDQVTVQLTARGTAGPSGTFFASWRPAAFGNVCDDGITVETYTVHAPTPSDPVRIRRYPVDFAITVFGAG